MTNPADALQLCARPGFASPFFVGPCWLDGVMSSRVAVGTGTGGVVRQSDRLDVFFEELAELAGQRNAIDGRIAQIAAE
ncbi:hypothetical protein R6244_25860, partial [Mycolicibacterium sp. D5.8-2]|nr:hypothetical protein [Mycolicibacterium sp. D5.8-2]